MARKKNPPASLVRSSAAEYLTFVAASGTDGVEAVYADENVWLSQKMMAQLYDVEIPTINYHLNKFVEDSELEEAAVLRSFRITAAYGKTYDTKHYNLSAIIAVGYKVNLSLWAKLALHHFELGVAIGSLTVGEDFDGVLPWGLVANRPFLRCLHGHARALLRRDRPEDAAAALRRLLRLDPADGLGAGATLAAIEAGKTWRELETAP